MAHIFPSWQSYSHFAYQVKQKERYVRSADTAAFLDLMTATAASRYRLLRTGTILWRAQLGFNLRTIEQDGHTFETPAAHPPERMKPLPFAKKEGRVNPVGIPALYMATDERTAVAEVRPWIGKHVSLAQFKVLRDVKLIDCSLEHSEEFTFYEAEPEPEERERAVWREVNRSFSEPVASDEPVTEYIPTQLLAEHFRAQGAEGIAYQSLLGGGRNIALFDLSAADLINCTLHYVRRVNFEHTEVDNPYYVTKHYPQLKSGA
jgi:hypothetical protein